MLSCSLIPFPSACLTSLIFLYSLHNHFYSFFITVLSQYLLPSSPVQLIFFLISFFSSFAHSSFLFLYFWFFYFFISYLFSLPCCSLSSLVTHFHFLITLIVPLIFTSFSIPLLCFFQLLSLMPPGVPCSSSALNSSPLLSTFQTFKK